jgi:hypothetical protein
VLSYAEVVTRPSYSRLIALPMHASIQASCISSCVLACKDTKALISAKVMLCLYHRGFDTLCKLPLYCTTCATCLQHSRDMCGQLHQAQATGCRLGTAHSSSITPSLAAATAIVAASANTLEHQSTRLVSWVALVLGAALAKVPGKRARVHGISAQICGRTEAAVND